MPDADLDATVNAIMGGAFGSAGERCMALPVVVAVGDETADKLIARLKPLVEALKVGPGCMRGGEENEMGPVVSDTHQKKCSAILIKAKAKGQNWWSMAANCACRVTTRATMSAAPCSITSPRR